MQEYHVFRDKRVEFSVARQRAILKGKLRSDKRRVFMSCQVIRAFPWR